jgi:hypothetical protein
MNHSVSHFLTTFCVLLTLGVGKAAGQTFEMVGERALGMGGAFVAVANDSTATWWNPAGLATGPFLDLSIGSAAGAADSSYPASRAGTWAFSLGTPPVGLSYYRLKITDIRAAPATAMAEGDREDRAAGNGVRSLSINQFGATVLHTITTGVTAAATVKYVRGTAHVRPFDGGDSVLAITQLLEVGEELRGGESEDTVDVDAGVLAIRGPVRLGLTGRNLREPRFGDRRLSRQIRLGAAFDGAAAGRAPVTVSVDADLRRYAAAAGDRRVVAVGGEYWVRSQRIALRGGARVNTVGERERTVTAGGSVAARAGLFVDGHVAVGGDTSERGWGLAARVSF